MNSLLRLTAATAAILTIVPGLSAQSLTITAPGYSATPLFQSTQGYTFGGLAFDGNANAFYIENDSNFTANAVLYRRSALDGYATATPLFDLGPGIGAYGSFVIFGDGKVYFGDGFGPIRSLNPDGTGIDLLGSVANNYDAALLNGNLYLSHGISFSPATNRVSKFELQPDGGGFALGSADTIVSADNDFSGPLEFDSGGNLYYGASGSSTTTGLFRFSASEVLGAFGPTQLTLDSAHRITDGIGNSSLAFGGGDDLWQDRFTGELNLIDTDDGSIQPIGISSNNPGYLDFVGDTLYVGVSTFTRSTAYAVVPEPSLSLMAIAGLAGLSMRRRR